MGSAQHGQHTEPAEHNGAKHFSYGSCTKLLQEEQYANDGQNNINDGIIAEYASKALMCA